MPRPNDITHPDHYEGSIEPVDFISSHQLCFILGNVVKYVTRAGRKGGQEISDLKKAKFYIEMKLHQVGSGEDPRGETRPLARKRVVDRPQG